MDKLNYLMTMLGYTIKDKKEINRQIRENETTKQQVMQSLTKKLKSLYR